jgi:hypothetical protein
VPPGQSSSPKRSVAQEIIMADDWGKADDWGAAPAQDDWSVAPAQDDWSVAPETQGDEQLSSEAAKEEEEKLQSEPDSKVGNDAKPPRKKEKASEGGKEKVEREPYVCIVSLFRLVFTTINFVQINPDRVATGGQQRVIFHFLRTPDPKFTAI